MLINLTDIKWLKRVIKHPLFPALFQWLTLAVFVALIVIGWNYHGIRGVELPDPLVYTNLTTLFFWVIWLMGLILLVALIGRWWCTICPLGYINDIVARFGFRLRFPHRLRNLYLAAFLLLFYNMVVALLSVNHYPDFSARLLTGITVLLILVGLLFRGRIFCGYLCPIGTMIGIYSRTSPWRLDVQDRKVCRECETKACYLGEKKWYKLETPLFKLTFPFHRPGCGVDLFPPELVEDPHCLMCTQCIKNCPHDNIRWGTRPFLSGVKNVHIPKASEALFLVFILGTIAGTFTRVWPALHRILSGPGEWLASLASPAGSRLAGVITLAWSNALLPALFFLFLSAVVFFIGNTRLSPVSEAEKEPHETSFSFGLEERKNKMTRKVEDWQTGRFTLKGIFSSFAMPLIPLLLSAHAAFALVKLNEKLSYLPGALADPTGVKFYLAIHKFGLAAAPRAIIPLPLVRWLALLLVSSGLLGTLYGLNKLSLLIYGEAQTFRRWGIIVFSGGYLVLGTGFLTLLVKWLF